MSKRFIAIILTLCMIAGMLPSNVFAASNHQSPKHISWEPKTNPLYTGLPKTAIQYFADPSGDGLPSDAEYVSDEDRLAVEIRAAMENREASVTVYYLTDNALEQADAEALFTLALEETGSATQGDYLRYVWQQYGMDAYYMQTEQGYKNSITYYISYYTTREQEAEVTAKVADVLASFGFDSTTTDYQKIKTIYDYICENVVYDYENLSDTTYLLKFTAYAALMNGTAVCQGYATLLYRMAMEAGVSARVIPGTSSGENHAWNIVELGGHWYNLDATWDAGVSEYSYFLKCESNFLDHSREAAYLSDAFQAQHPMNSEDYTPVVTASGTCGENVNWVLCNGVLTISGSGYMDDYPREWIACEAEITSIVIEEGIENIGAYAFRGCIELTSITIPVSVTSIGDGAFEGCTGLKSVSLPAGLFSIGTYTFSQCSGLTSLELPESVTSIGACAFMSCSSLISLELPKGVTSIGNGAFAYCSGLQSIELPTGVISIGSSTFMACKGLKSITLPEGLTSIGNSALGCCTELEYVVFSGDMPEININAFNSTECCIYYPLENETWTEDVKQNYGGTITWIAYEGDYPVIDGNHPGEEPGETPGEGSGGEGSGEGSSGEGETDTENTVDWAFEDGVLTISGTGRMPKLADMGLPWMEYSKIVTKIVIQEGITSVSGSAFVYFHELVSVELPESLIELEEYAFSNCSQLSEIQFGKNLRKIGQGALRHGYNLGKVTFTGDAPIFDRDVFYGNITTVYYPYENATWTADVKWDYGGEITWVAVDKDGNFIVDNENNTNSECYSGICGDKVTWELRDCVLTIRGSGDMYDYGYMPGTESPWFQHSEKIHKVVIEDGITNVGNCAFYECTDLQEVELPESVGTISAWGFHSCEKLECINLPDELSSIENRAFRGCSELKHLTIPASVSIIGKGAFKLCGKLELLVESDNKRYYTDDGALIDNQEKELIFYPKSRNQTEYRVPDGIKTLGMHVFDGCKLRKVILPDTLVNISDGAFESCYYLSELVLPENLESIGEGAFYDCRSLTEIILPESVQSFGVAVFDYCTSIGRMVFPENMKEIPYATFSSCNHLNEVVICGNVAAIGSCAFLGCRSLKRVVFYGDAPAFDAQTFRYVNATVEVYYPANNSSWTDEVLQNYGAEANGGNIIWIPFTEDPEPIHTHKFQVTVVPPSCVDSGYVQFNCACGEAYQDIYTDKSDAYHNEQILPGKESSCTETGVTEGKHCSVCKVTLVAQEVVPALGHDEVTHESRAATCTEIGWNAYVTCSRCLYSTYAEISALGHTEVINEAVASTCTETGLTEGKYCTVCKEVLIAQEVVPANGHTEVIDTAVAATCTATGLTEGKHCSVCSEVLIAQEVVSANGHTEVIDQAVEATCTATGLTEGKYCSVCKEVLVAQEVVPADGHNWNNATCTKPKTCAVCLVTEGDPFGHSYTTEDDVVYTCGICGNSFSMDIESIVRELAENDEVSQDAVKEAVTKVQNIETGHLENAMKADTENSNVVDQIAQLENFVDIAVNVVVDAETADVIDQSKVAIIGAKLNAAENQQEDIILAIGKPEGDAVLMIPEGYEQENSLRFSMTLENVENTDDLNVPVKISLPIPDNMNPERVEILHYNADGTVRDVIKPDIIKNEDQYFANFVLNSFCNFAVVESHEHIYESIVTDPTCTKAGYTTHICGCGDAYVDGQTDALGHDEASHEAKAPTCTENGWDAYVTCSRCDYTTYKEKGSLGHTEVAVAGKAATCTSKGLTEGKKCSVCGIVTVAQKEIGALGHKETTVAGKVATCTAKGLTEGKKCSICGTVTVAQKEIAQVAHKGVVVAGKAATCTTRGLTDGKNCSVCGIVTVAQKEIGAKGHTEVTIAGKAATCTAKGLTEGKKCSVCGTVTVAQKEIAAKSHTEVAVAGKAATCISKGLSEGKKCSVCGTVTIEQKEIAVKAHSFANGKCSACGTKDPNYVAPTEPKPTEPAPTEPKPSEPSQPEVPTISGVNRVAGSNRYGTSLSVADQLKTYMGVDKFNNIVVACGNDYADALSGSYLANKKGAPILLVNKKNMKSLDDIVPYIVKNLASGGKVYILGGTSAVPAELETRLNQSGISNITRFAGNGRYDTNLMILKEAGISANEAILICTGNDYADALSASATGMPILLVNKNLNKLRDDQKAFLAGLKGNKLYLIGGTSAVSENIANEVAAYGTPKRLAGSGRYETSVIIAKEFFKNPASVVLAYGHNFPDGLCGGSLGYCLKAPIILTRDRTNTYAVEYAKANGITKGFVLGGTSVLSQDTVNKVFG